MIISIGGICGLRVFFVFVLFPLYPVLASVYLSYGASWLVTAAIQAVCLLVLLHRFIQSSRSFAERNAV